MKVPLRTSNKITSRYILPLASILFGLVKMISLYFHLYWNKKHYDIELGNYLIKKDLLEDPKKKSTT